MSSVGGSVCSCVSGAANSDGLTSRALIDSGGSNILDSDSTPESGGDCVVRGDGALVNSGGDRNDGGHNGLVLAVAKRAVSNGGCTGRNGDDSGAVDSCGAGRAVLATIGLDGSGLSSAGDAGNGALGADGLNSGRGDSAGDEAGRAAAESDSVSLDLSRHDSHGGGTSGPVVGTKAKSGIQTSINVGALNGTVVGASAGGGLEGGTNTAVRGRTDIDTVGEGSRESDSLTLAVGSDLQSGTDDAVVAVNGEASLQCIGDDSTVELGADQRLGTHRGRCAGRARDGRGAGGSRVERHRS